MRASKGAKKTKTSQSNNKQSDLCCVLKAVPGSVPGNGESTHRSTRGGVCPAGCVHLGGHGATTGSGVNTSSAWPTGGIDKCGVKSGKPSRVRGRGGA